MSQKSTVIRHLLARKGFIPGDVQYVPFPKGMKRTAYNEFGGWKAEATCKTCGLVNTFGGLSIEETIYSITSIGCLICQALNMDLATLVAVYPAMGGEIKGGNIAIVGDGNHGDEMVYQSLTRQQVIDDIGPLFAPELLRMALDSMPKANIASVQLAPPSAIHDFLRGYMNEPQDKGPSYAIAEQQVEQFKELCGYPDQLQARESVDDNFGPSTTYTRLTYKHWHYSDFTPNPDEISFPVYPSPENLRCSGCKASCMPLDPSWRFTGTSFEHKCPGNHPMAGYFAAEPIESPKE